jgi:hypothetical protein
VEDFNLTSSNFIGTACTGIAALDVLDVVVDATLLIELLVAGAFDELLDDVMVADGTDTDDEPMFVVAIIFFPRNIRYMVYCAGQTPYSGTDRLSDLHLILSLNKIFIRTDLFLLFPKDDQHCYTKKC